MPSKRVARIILKKNYEINLDPQSVPVHIVHMPAKNNHRLVAWVPKKGFDALRKKLFLRGKSVSTWLRDKIREAIN